MLTLMPSGKNDSRWNRPDITELSCLASQASKEDIAFSKGTYKGISLVFLGKMEHNIWSFRNAV